MTDRIAEAVDYAACDKCGSSEGDPCRSPSGRTAAPHAGRLLISEVREIEFYKAQAKIDAAAERASALRKERNAKAHEESKIRKHGRVASRTRIEGGDELVSSKRAERRERKAARRRALRGAEWAAAKGALLARANAKAARAGSRKASTEAVERAARRTERREAGIAARSAS